MNAPDISFFVLLNKICRPSQGHTLQHGNGLLCRHAALLFALLLLALATPALAQQVTSISVSGTCGELAVNVTGEDLLDGGCWDVKIDAPGQVRDKDGDWVSSVYYVDKVLCPWDGSAVVGFRPDGTGTVDGRVKIRLGSRVVEKTFPLSRPAPRRSLGCLMCWWCSRPSL
jgi:hypothetical protein